MHRGAGSQIKRPSSSTTSPRPVTKRASTLAIRATNAAIEDVRDERDDLTMNPDEFADAIKLAAFDPAVSGVLHHLREGAPGRGRHPRADALSSWFNSISERDQAMVAEVARDAAHAAIFHTLCVLDGVSTIDDPPHASLVLTAVSADGKSSVIASGESVVELHDEFNAVVHPPSEPWPPAE